MNKNNTRKQLKYLGYYQIIGGLIGLILILYTYAITSSKLLNNGLKGIAIFLMPFILYLFSSYCGFLLLQKKFARGIKLSKINQLLQILSFSVFGYTYQYASGILFGVKLDITDDIIGGILFWVSDIEIGYSSNEEIIWMGVNIMALIILLRIFKLSDNLKV